MKDRRHDPDVVRVNLLPDATRDRHRSGRQRGVLAASGVGLLVVLAAVQWWVAGTVDDARETVAAEQDRTMELRGELNDLAEFQALQTRDLEARAVVLEAMAGEVSIAGFLQDLAAVVPPDAQLDVVTLSLASPTVPSDPRQGPTVGAFTVEGYSLAGLAPGVERFLVDLDRFDTFRDLYLTSTELDDTDVEDPDPTVWYLLEGQVGASALTGRYLEGVPEVLQ